MILLIGPAVAVVGIVAVFFVMRHKSVEKHSMYASRRSQIEHKVRAARQRTLGPTKRSEKPGRAVEEVSPATSSVQTWQQPAYTAPPAPPPAAAPAQPAWDMGPTTPAPSPPTYATQAPPTEPAVPESPAPSQWTPAPAAPEVAQPQPDRPAPAPAPATTTSAGGGAAWSVVGETKGVEAEPAPAGKKKKSKDQTQGGAWTLASGEVAGEDADEGPRKPSAALAIAQYAVLVVGLIMVLIGVVVMVANSHGT
jgi:hypothetical protein